MLHWRNFAIDGRIGSVFGGGDFGAGELEVVMKCGDCRHWQEIDTYASKIDGFGTCERIRAFENICSGEPNEEEAKEKAMTVDGSGFYSALKTKGDFGCVLHEPKQQA